ncbi:hypothetical protein TFGB2_01386 [Neisseria gonorrhoeae]|nr:hypothetical protein TFGB2_01386 [Neisseria gonorrhoeae]
MRAVGIAETALQKRPRPPYFDKPSEQSAGCRLVRTPKISAGIFSHLSALSPFALSGCGHRAEQAAVESCFIRTNALAVGKSGRPCQIMRYFGRVLSFVSGGLFLRAIRICLGAWQTAAAVQSKCLAISCRQASGCRPTYRAGFCLSDLAAFRPVT